MRLDGRQPFKVLVSNHIMSPTESCGWVLPNSFPNLTLPFGTSGGRRECHHLERRSWRRGDSTDDGRSGCLTFLLFSLCFFVSIASWDRGSFFIPLTRAYLSLLYLVAISVKTKSKRDARSRNKWTKKKKRRRKVCVLFSSRSIFLNMYREGSGPRQWSYRQRGSTKSSKLSIPWANSKVASTRL